MSKFKCLLVIALVIVITLPITACSATSTSGTELSDITDEDLQGNGDPQDNGDLQDTEVPIGTAVGQAAFDFTLMDVTGTEYTLSQLYAEKSVVMVFGSYT